MLGIAKDCPCLGGFSQPYDIGAPANRQTNWEFYHGKLANVFVPQYLDPKRGTTVEDELDLLKQAYGKPAEIGRVPMQNGFGAVFSLYQATWLMPDGTHITASERTDGPDHFLDVLLQGPEYERKHQDSA